MHYKQLRGLRLEYHITRRMAIANRTFVSFGNQPKAQFGYLNQGISSRRFPYMSLPSSVLRVGAFGYVKRVMQI